MRHLIRRGHCGLAAWLFVWVLCITAAIAGCGARQEIASQPLAPAVDANSFQPFCFILAGDPQTGGWTSIADTKARFIKLAHIANEVQPAFVLVVGDLVNDGPHPAELAAFDEGLAQFHTPTKLLCGNHDDLPTYRRKYGRDYCAFTQNNCEFICINSNFIAHQTPSSQDKAEADAQWAFLDAALAAATREHRAHIFLAMHHPPEFLPLWAQRRLADLQHQYAIEVVLAGHIHRTAEFVHKGYVTYTVAGTGWAGDKKGFGYRLFKVYADRIEQEYLTLDAPMPSAALTPTLSPPATQPAGQ